MSKGKELFFNIDYWPPIIDYNSSSVIQNSCLRKIVSNKNNMFSLNH